MNKNALDDVHVGITDDDIISVIIEFIDRFDELDNALHSVPYLMIIQTITSDGNRKPSRKFHMTINPWKLG